MIKPTIEIKTIARNIHIVHPPNNSKLPNPNVDAPNAKRGKQQGENSAVKNRPPVPNLSMLFVSFIFKLILQFFPLLNNLSQICKSHHIDFSILKTECI